MRARSLGSIIVNRAQPWRAKALTQPFLKEFTIRNMPDPTEKRESRVRFSAATTADKLLPQRLALRARPLLDRLDGLLFGRDARGEAGRISVIAFAVRIFSALIAFVSQV